MKKLVMIYIFSITAVFLITYFVSLNKNGEQTALNLPQTINVYFADEQITREMNLEDYLVCVVSAEVPAQFHEEAIKAQAVAARTYIYNKYKKFTADPTTAPAEHKDAVVCTDSKHCCAYYSKEKLVELHGEEWMKQYYDKLCDAVEDTRGEVIMYENEPIIAVFHASSGGCRTENSEEVWSSKVPYLVSVGSPGEDKREGYNTVVNVSCEEFKKKVNENYPEAQLGDDRNTWIGDMSFTKGNSVNYINIGRIALRGTQVRSLFGLKSACFEISMLNDTITFNVHGSGHGVGMSQHGANLMAQDGKKYKDILKWYYTGVEICK